MKDCADDKERSLKTKRCIKRCSFDKIRGESGKCVKRGELTLSKKQHSFNEALQSAKEALDSVNIPFHLHYGTALGAHREHKFIEHDGDIDLAVFSKDVSDKETVAFLKKAMRKHGFKTEATLGKINSGFELQFSRNDVDLDIFWVYDGLYRDKNYYIVSSYYGSCDNLPKKTCVWGYEPYVVETIPFLGKDYSIVPRSTLKEMYGEDWNIVKKYTYQEGIDNGGYKGFLKDYYKPKDLNNNIAFCFLLYDTVKHSKIWEKFLKQDNGIVKSWSVYTHPKMITENTQEWVKKSRIRNIVKTGWCENSLVLAWINLLKAALKDERNQYFAILSGDCIPIRGYDETYNGIVSDKRSRFNIEPDAEVTQDTGLVYADQWCIVNRQHAQLIVDLKETEDGKKFYNRLNKMKCADGMCYCPDELYPINWMIENFGKPSSRLFKKNIKLQQTTYTKWDGINPSPIKINGVKLKKLKKKICDSGAFFGRKFNNKAAREIFEAC